MNDASELVVLQVLPDPRRYPGPVENPYTSLLVDSLDHERFTIRYFRWSRVFFEHFDVVHFHWPEYLARHRRPLLASVKRTLLRAFLLRVRLQRKALVRTVHNTAPHELGSDAERTVLTALDKMTTSWVILNPTTPTPDGSRTQLIPHGHYRDWYDPIPERAPIRGRILMFGLLRAYKGAESLIEAFKALPSEGSYRLRIAGKPASADDAARIIAAVETDARISTTLRFLGDDELVSEVATAEAVILPYRNLHNSGAALLALSLNCPIVVPYSNAADWLVQEFGAEWVVTYSGDLSARTLAEALRAVRDRVRSPEVANMAAREWPALAEQLQSVYTTAARRSKRPVT